MTTQKIYDDSTVVLVTAIVGSTRPVTFNVSDADDLSGAEITAPNFDVRIEDELLRVTAVTIDGGGTGIDTWTAAHLGGAAAGGHSAGQEVQVILSASGIQQYIADQVATLA